MDCEKCMSCDVDQKIMLCKNEVGQQIESLKSDLMCIKDIQTDVKELLNIFTILKNTRRGLIWAGKGIRFAALTSAAIGALLLTIKAVWHAAIAWLR